MRITRLSLLTSAFAVPVALMLCASSGASAQSLSILNPSFETQTSSSSGFVSISGSAGYITQNITGWNITNDYTLSGSTSIAGVSINSTLAGQDGNNIAYLGNGQINDRGGDLLSQQLSGALSVVKVGTYDLKVLVGNNGVQPAGLLGMSLYGAKSSTVGSVTTVTVYSSAPTANNVQGTSGNTHVNNVNIANASTTVDETKIASGHMVLEDFVYTVHAGDAIIGSNLGVSFENLTADKISLIDDVSITYAVPEPGVFALFAGVMLTVGGALVSRRRK